MAEGSRANRIRDVRETTCCIVGAGPAGAMLALLLARQRVPVVLLEAHGDFHREFRGDSLHPAIMEVLDEIGLADRVLAELPHRKVRQVTFPTRPPTAIQFSRLLHTRFPFITLMPQSRFLEFLTAEAARYPSFELIMRANVRELIIEGGAIRGVRYRGPAGWGEVRARLTVGADGRFSQIRRLSGARPIVFSSPMDVLWFRLPRIATDPEGVVGGAGHGHMLLMGDRGDHWQIGSIIAKGEFPRLRAAGLDSLRAVIVDLVPWLAERIHHLADWKQVSLLSVACDTLPKWWRPGLLMIGDAAHVMSPVAGNGINYAVQDVAAANLLAEPLAAGHLTDAHLAAVQRRRQWPTRITQAVVGQIQDRALARMLRPGSRAPNARVVRALTRIPGLPYLPLRLAAFGLRPEHVRLSPPEGPSGQ